MSTSPLLDMEAGEKLGVAATLRKLSRVLPQVDEDERPQRYAAELARATWERDVLDSRARTETVHVR